MKLYLLRHGIAADSEEWSGTDADRPLTREGRQRMALEAKALAKLDLGIDAILTSPLVRAKQTACIVAERVKTKDGALEDVRLGPGFDPVGVAGILNDHAAAFGLLLVGHDPSMTEMITYLTGARADLKKGGMACIELSDASPQSGRLLWLVPPKMLI